MSDPNKKSPVKLASLFALILALGVGIAFSIGSSTVIEQTNTTEFCTSCHSMQWVKEEWMASYHYSNASGVRAGCPDCHVPHDLGPKLYAKMLAAKDVWGEIMGTIDSKEKFEQHRWTMANRVWAKMEATDSRECKECHTFEAMDLSEQAKMSRRKHKQAEQDGETCIDCHKGVAHRMPRRPKTDRS